MNKGGYLQPATQEMMQDNIQPADLDKWATANRDIWRLVSITGTPLGGAKDIVLGSWDSAERTRFEAWVSFYESEDDKKYPNASYTMCDIGVVKTAAIKIAAALGGNCGEVFKARIESTDNVKTIIDYIRAMNRAKTIVKTASEDEDRATRMFNIIRDVQEELSKKKMVRSLARLFSMDRDGMFPEVPQALAKLIESYGYATTRVQDVMGRLGLQLSMSSKEESGASDKLSGVVAPAEAKKPNRLMEPAKPLTPPTAVPAGITPKAPPAKPAAEESGQVMLPRVSNRG